jgi:hypothetical protein
LLSTLPKKKSKSAGRVSGKRRTRNGDLKKVRAIKQGTYEGAEGNQNLWSMTRAQPRTIVVKGDIANGMQRHLAAPLTANQSEDTERRSLARRDTSEQRDDVLGYVAYVTNRHGSRTLSHACHSRSRSQRGVHIRAHPETADLSAPALIITRAIAEARRTGIGTRRCQVRVTVGCFFVTVSTTPPPAE